MRQERSWAPYAVSATTEPPPNHLVFILSGFAEITATGDGYASVVREGKVLVEKRGGGPHKAFPSRSAGSVGPADPPGSVRAPAGGRRKFVVELSRRPDGTETGLLSVPTDTPTAKYNSETGVATTVNESFNLPNLDLYDLFLQGIKLRDQKRPAIPNKRGQLTTGTLP